MRANGDAWIVMVIFVAFVVMLALSTRRRR
jgi:hypothetical protein